MAKETATKSKHGFWEFKKYQEHEWFQFLIKLLIGTILLYLGSHLLVRQFDRNAGYEYETMGKEEMQHINRIYFAQADTVTPTQSEEGGEETDSLPVETAILPGAQADDIAVQTDRVIEYVRNHFNQKIDSGQLEQIRSHLRSGTRLEAVSFWSNVRLRIRSYFWLVGPEVYFEIIFWTLLGVITSLIFSLGVVGRNRTTDPENATSVFDSSEIPYQFAKLWYAPIITLVIVLGYNFFQDDNIADISSSKGIIVFAFVGGFYSARLIAFLDRLKEVLLPVSSTSELPEKKTVAPLVQNTTVALRLDAESVDPALATEIAEMGFANASITLENEENGDEITAQRSGEDQAAEFTVNSLRPGRYTVKANWSGEVNDQPVNLTGLEKAEIKSSDTTISVLMKKDESEG